MPSRRDTSAGIFGHDTQRESFVRLAENGALRHAYLFFGDDGVGKFRFASAFAHFLERGTWETDPSSPLADMTVVARGDEERSLGIDAVRAIRHFLSQTPAASSYRTVIVRDAEDLTREAESALLKIMEEPPLHSLIVMIARDPSGLFPPLASRMAKIYFSRLPRGELAVLLAAHLGISSREAAALARRAFGRFGYACTLAKPHARRGARVANDSLAAAMEAHALALWENDPKENVEALSYVLRRMEAAARFNLNPALQEKAISVILS